MSDEEEIITHKHNAELGRAARQELGLVGSILNGLREATIEDLLEKDASQDEILRLRCTCHVIDTVSKALRAMIETGESAEFELNIEEISL